MPLRYLVCCLLLLAGCPSPNTTLPPMEPAEEIGTLRVLVLDDPPLAAAISREWSARTGKEIEVAEMTVAEFAKVDRLGTDVIIYPPGLLGALAEAGKIVPIADDLINSTAFDRRDLLPLARQYEMRWGEETYAVPLSCPRLALVYRTDLLAALKLEPPRTWSEYLRAAELLADRSKLGDLAPADGLAWSGTLEPLGESWRSEMLLARAGSSIRRQGHLSSLFDFVSMDATIDAPPFVAALENMRAAAAHQPTGALTIDPTEVRRRFLAGESGMAITWLPTPFDPNRAEGAGGETLSIGVAPIPGSDSYFDFTTEETVEREDGIESVPLVGFAGRVGSVSSGSARKRQAFDLLALLAGKQWSTDVARRSALAHPFRRGQVEQLAAWLPAEIDATAASEYRAYLEQLELNQLVMVSPRLPGRLRYMAALDHAIDDCLQQNATADEATAKTASEWNEITKEIGIEEQRNAYRRSSGIGR